MIIVFAEPIGLSLEQKKDFSNELTGLGHTAIFFDSLPKNQDELFLRIHDADIVVVSNYQISEVVIEKLPNLKLVAVAFTGYDHIPAELCREKGIMVCNAAGYSTYAVAELTIALAITLFRKIPDFNTTTRNLGTRNGFLGMELREKIFGIIGLGNIGQQVAKLAQAFGCKTIAYSKTLNGINNIQLVNLEELISMADIISIHLPLNEQTRGLFNEDKFRMMKPNAILINTARGPIVDYTELSFALKNNIISGAAIDVYNQEPPLENNHPLFDTPNTILLPHIGFATKEAINKRNLIVMNNIKSWLEGRPVNRVI